MADKPQRAKPYDKRPDKQISSSTTSVSSAQHSAKSNPSRGERQPGTGSVPQPMEVQRSPPQQLPQQLPQQQAMMQIVPQHEDLTAVVSQLVNLVKEQTMNIMRMMEVTAQAAQSAASAADVASRQQ